MTVPWLQAVITKLAARPPDEETAWEIARVFEKRREPAGSALEPDELQALRAAVIASIRRLPSGGALWALGKCCDPALRPVFEDALESLLATEPVDAGAAYQAMIALDNLDLDPFGGRKSMSAFEDEQNLSDARAYLARVRG